VEKTWRVNLARREMQYGAFKVSLHSYGSVVTAGKAAYADIPVCSESGFTRFCVLRGNDANG
jgi:hypothetical protein